MKIIRLITGTDTNSYNMNIILIYFIILIIAFIVCLVISQKINIYGSKELNQDIESNDNLARRNEKYEQQEQ